MSELFLGRWHDTDAFFSPFWLLIALKPVSSFSTTIELHFELKNSLLGWTEKLIQYAQTWHWFSTWAWSTHKNAHIITSHTYCTNRAIPINIWTSGSCSVHWIVLHFCGGWSIHEILHHAKLSHYTVYIPRFVYLPLLRAIPWNHNEIH